MGLGQMAKGASDNICVLYMMKFALAALQRIYTLGALLYEMMLKNTTSIWRFRLYILVGL